MALQNSLSEKLGTSVSIVAKANGAGTLKINYSNLMSLMRLLKKFQVSLCQFSSGNNA